MNYPQWGYEDGRSIVFEKSCHIIGKIFPGKVFGIDVPIVVAFQFMGMHAEGSQCLLSRRSEDISRKARNGVLSESLPDFSL